MPTIAIGSEFSTVTATYSGGSSVRGARIEGTSLYDFQPNVLFIACTLFSVAPFFRSASSIAIAIQYYAVLLHIYGPPERGPCCVSVRHAGRREVTEKSIATAQSKRHLRDSLPAPGGRILGQPAVKIRSVGRKDRGHQHDPLRALGRPHLGL